MENIGWKGVIQPSRHFALLLLILHATCALVLYVTDIRLAISLMIFLLISVSLSYYWARDIWLDFPDSWREIVLNKNGVSVVVRDGSSLAGRLENKITVFSCFVILSVKFDGRYRTAYRVIARDALNPEIFRQLCVYLKFAR
jgi:hypothetical protein